MTLLRDLGWVIDSVAAGRIPEPAVVDPAARAAAFAWIGFLQVAPATATCPAVADPSSMALAPGDRLQVRAASGPDEVIVTDLVRDLSTTFPTDASGALDLDVSAGPLTAEIRVTGADAATVGLCR